MPCDGPSKAFSDKKAEDFYLKVMFLMKCEHGIDQPNSPWASLDEDFKKQSNQLRETLKEIFWTDACASW